MKAAQAFQGRPPFRISSARQVDQVELECSRTTHECVQKPRLSLLGQIRIDLAVCYLIRRGPEHVHQILLLEVMHLRGYVDRKGAEERPVVYLHLSKRPNLGCVTVLRGRDVQGLGRQ